MKKCLMMAGLLCGLAPLARADVGVVSRLDGPNMTLQVAQMKMRVGEWVLFDEVPQRQLGTGHGIVTDVDPHTHRVAVVLMPMGGKSRSRRGGDTGGTPQGGSALLGSRVGDFRVFPDDTLRIRSLERFEANPPTFHLTRVEAPVQTFPDFMMPSGYFGRPTGAKGSTPAGRTPSTMPDVNAVLRSLEGNTESPDEADSPEGSPSTDTPQARSKGGEFRKVARVVPRSRSRK